MQFLSTDVAQEVARYLTSIAPGLAAWAESCKFACSLVRLLYCQHCGLIFDTGSSKSSKAGRGGHPVSCAFAEELDPWRHVFKMSCLDWRKSIVAGGWPAFVHFREHRRYVNPWRKGGEIAGHDLDVFFFGGWSILSLYNDLRKNSLVCNLEIEKPPSKWSQEYGRNDTEQNANAGLCFRLTHAPGFLYRMDLLGEKTYSCHSPQDILKTFDLPWCSVGFQVMPKRWHLADGHHAFFLKSVPEGHFQRLQERLHKYAQRGYRLGSIHECDCDCYAVKGTN